MNEKKKEWKKQKLLKSKPGLIEAKDLLNAINGRSLNSVTDTKRSNRNGWHEIDRRKVEMKVREIQEKIIIATIPFFKITKKGEYQKE